MKYVLHTLILLAFVSSPLLAQMEGNPANWCRQGFFTRDSKEFGVGFVKGKKGSRAYFYGDEEAKKCPAGKGCKLRSYLTNGDEVITNRSMGKFVCAWFTPAKGAPTVGWLLASDIDFPSMLSDASSKVWSGDWDYADNSIKITTAKDDQLVIKGTAIWKGPADNVHIGELDGTFKHKNGVVEYSDGDGEYDCRATLQLATGNFVNLIVADNMNCGGVNVSFSGIYRKMKPRTKK